MKLDQVLSGHMVPAIKTALAALGAEELAAVVDGGQIHVATDVGLTTWVSEGDGETVTGFVTPWQHVTGVMVSASVAYDGLVRKQQYGITTTPPDRLDLVSDLHDEAAVAEFSGACLRALGETQST